jgi:hypothetical protein
VIHIASARYNAPGQAADCISKIAISGIQTGKVCFTIRVVISTKPEGGVRLQVRGIDAGVEASVSDVSMIARQH